MQQKGSQSLSCPWPPYVATCLTLSRRRAGAGADILVPFDMWVERTMLEAVAVSVAWPQYLKRHAPMLESLQFFRPAFLDILVFIFFREIQRLPPDDEPWRSCKATQRDDEWD